MSWPRRYVRAGFFDSAAPCRAHNTAEFHYMQVSRAQRRQSLHQHHASPCIPPISRGVGRRGSIYVENNNQ